MWWKHDLFYTSAHRKRWLSLGLVCSEVIQGGWCVACSIGWGPIGTATLRTIWCVKTPKTTSKTTSIMPPVFHKPQRPGFSAMRCASIPWLHRASRDGGQLHLVRLTTCPTIQASRATKEPKLQDYLISTWSVSYNVQESISLKPLSW